MSLLMAKAGLPGPFVRAWDDFTDADGTLLENHTASDGGAWVKSNGSDVGSAVIDGSRVHNSDSATNHQYRRSWTPPSANYRVSVLLRVLEDNNSSAGGPAARIDPAANTLYWMRYTTNGNNWNLWKRVAGTTTQLGSSVNQNLTLNQDYLAEIDVDGSSITAYVDGVPIIAVEDAAITGAGSAGLLLVQPATAAIGVHLDRWRVVS